MSVQSWSSAERLQVIATGLAPLVVASGVAAIGTLQLGTESIFLLVMLVPAAYATLFFFIFPALWLLRRLEKESILSFAATCGLGTLFPWLLLYAALLPGASKYGGAPLYALAILAVPATLASVAGAFVFWLGRSTSTEVMPNPSVKGTSRKRAAPYVER